MKQQNGNSSRWNVSKFNDLKLFGREFLHGEHHCRLDQRLNISKDVNLLFFSRSLSFQVIRPDFHAPHKKRKQATLLEFQYKRIGKTLLQARKLAFL